MTCRNAVNQSEIPKAEISVALTRREVFASRAMQGMLANNDGVNRVWEGTRKNNPHISLENTTDLYNEFFADRAVELADALIKKLDGQNAHSS